MISNFSRSRPMHVEEPLILSLLSGCPGLTALVSCGGAELVLPFELACFDLRTWADLLYFLHPASQTRQD
jgi:hypothetical protein